MPKEVFKLAETVYHAFRVEGLLLLHAFVDFDTHALEEFIDLAVYLLVGLHGLGSALSVWALLQDCLKLLHAF